MAKKKILIVGAGAVGQVYGYQLASAGHDVHFFVKEKYKEELEQGLTLYKLNTDKQKSKPIQFNNFRIVTDWAQAQQHSWDQVYLTISSTALQGLDLKALKTTLGNATLGLMQPGPHDLALVAKIIPAAQIVQGLITLISYAAPLPGEQVSKPGVAYWLPPMAATPFNGEAVRRTDLITTFTGSGMAAKSNKNLGKSALFPTAFLMTFLTALEAADWKFSRLQNDQQLLDNMIAAKKEAFSAVASAHGAKEPLWAHMNSTLILKALIRIAPHAVPLDLETYFKVHFTKVKDQTKLFMQTYIDDAKQQQLPANHLMALNQLT